jgi:hypothetical protein
MPFWMLASIWRTSSEIEPEYFSLVTPLPGAS